MHGYGGSFLAAIFFLLYPLGLAWGQNGVLEERPKVVIPKKPPTRQELDRRESLHKYVHGLICENEEKMKEALEAYEEAARLDPEEPAVLKAQLPILIALDRLDDALKACQKVLRLDPGDFHMWYVEAKLYKSRARYAEAIQALEKGLKTEAIKDHPEASQGMYFELGSLLETAEKFGPAADAYNKAAAILEHPDLIMTRGPFPREAIHARAAETYEKIGRLYRKAKQTEPAIAALRKAQEHAPERAGRLSFHIAEVFAEQGNLKQALAHVETFLRTQPLGLEAYDMKIDLLKRLKQTDGIVSWLEAAAQRDRFNNGLQLMLAREYAFAKQPAKAEAIYKKLAEESPSADLYRGLFHLYKNEGAQGKARILAMLNKVMDRVTNEEGAAPAGNVPHAKAMVGALREDGELAKDLVQTAFEQVKKQDDLKFDTLYFLALLADRHRKTEEAELFYRKCLPGATAASEPVLYGGLLRVLGKARKNEAIVKVCAEGLLKAKATNPLLFYNDQARALASLHRYDEALRVTDRALERVGDDNKLLFKILRVRILTMADRYDDAEAECQALLKAYQRPAEAVELRYILSGVYAAAKHSAKAEEQLHLILKIDPNNPTVNNDLGYLWADQGKNLEVAEAMIRKALDNDRFQRRHSPSFDVAEDKDNAAYVDSLGWILFRRGQIDEARKELERATTLGDGDDPVIYDHLGDVYNRLNMRPEARRSWQRALELYDQGTRRKEDDRVRDIQRKINQAKEEIGKR